MKNDPLSVDNNTGNIEYKGKLVCVQSDHIFLSFICQNDISIYLKLLSRSITDHHLRCGGWLNFEFSKRGKTFGMGH